MAKIMEKKIRGKAEKMSKVDKVKGNLVVKLTKDGCVDAEIVIDGDNIKWTLWIGGDYGMRCVLADEGVQTLTDLADIINKISEVVKSFSK